MNIWDNEAKIRKAVELSSSKTETIKKLGMNPKGSITRKKLRLSIKKFGIDISHFDYRYSEKRWQDIDRLKQIVKECISFTEVLERLDLFPRSGSFITLKKRLIEHNIDFSHFDPVEAARKTRKKSGNGVIPLSEILEGLHPSYKTYGLKARLVREGIKEEKCEECGLTEWNGKPLTFELHHINGINNDHRIENLKVLCPNCHSQTSTYKAKNKAKSKTQKSGTLA